MDTTTEYYKIKDLLQSLHENEGGFELEIDATKEDVDVPEKFKQVPNLPISIPSYTANSILTTRFYDAYLQSLMFFKGANHVCKIPYHAIINNSINPIAITEQDKILIHKKRNKFKHATFSWRQTEKGIVILIKLKEEGQNAYCLFLASPGMPDREIIMTEKTVKVLHELLQDEFSK